MGTVRLDGQSLHVQRAGRAVLAGVDIGLQAGRCVGVIGPNGAGKSTVLAVLAGVLAADPGQVLLDGVPLQRVDRWERARRVGYLPQHAQAGWPMPVRDVVALGRLPWRAAWAADALQDARSVDLAMEQTDIAQFAARPITSLSGGELARAMLAVVLAGQPDILLVDEPVAALDPGHQLAVLQVLRARARAGAAVLIALHDLTLAARFCDELLVLHHGQVVKRGVPGAVLTEPMLAQVYGIRAARGFVAGETFVLPWSTVGSKDADQGRQTDVDP
jgi:iron complex transport system ATP-binding protein